MAEASEFLEREGTVVHVQDTRMLGEDPRFQKQVGGFTIEKQRQYKDKQGELKMAHDYITFDCEGKVMSQLPGMGDKVKVTFTISGTYWKKGQRYFNKLRAIKIETLEYAPKSKQPAPVRQDDVSFLNSNQPDNDFDGDDLPF